MPSMYQRAVDSQCAVCGGNMFYQACPTGGWWIHREHPEDDHDGEPWQVSERWPQLDAAERALLDRLEGYDLAAE